MKGNQSGLYIIIIGFIAILFGSIAAVVISDQTQDVSTLTQQTDTFTFVRIAGGANNYTTTYTLSALGQPWREDISTCSKATLGTSANIYVYNQSGSEMMNNGACGVYPGGSNDYYYVDGSNTLKLCNSPDMNNSATYATVKYETCPVGYVGSSWGRTVLNMVPGFYILGILAVSVGLALWFLRKEGLM